MKIRLVVTVALAFCLTLLAVTLASAQEPVGCFLSVNVTSSAVEVSASWEGASAGGNFVSFSNGSDNTGLMLPDGSSGNVVAFAMPIDMFDDGQWTAVLYLGGVASSCTDHFQIGDTPAAPFVPPAGLGCVTTDSTLVSWGEAWQNGLVLRRWVVGGPFEFYEFIQLEDRTYEPFNRGFIQSSNGQVYGYYPDGHRVDTILEVSYNGVVVDLLWTDDFALPGELGLSNNLCEVHHVTLRESD